MKILFLTQTFPRFEGDTAGPFILEIARALVRGGDEVTVLTPHAEDVPERWQVDSVEVRSFRYAPERWELIGYSRSLDRDESMKAGAAAVAPAYAWGARRALRRAVGPTSASLPPLATPEATRVRRSRQVRVAGLNRRQTWPLGRH